MSNILIKTGVLCSNFKLFVQSVSNFNKIDKNLGQNLEHYKLEFWSKCQINSVKTLKTISSNVSKKRGGGGESDFTVIYYKGFHSRG